jgi:hypothetical protein
MVAGGGVADDAATYSERSTRKRGLARHEESLAGDERWGVLTSVLGRKATEREASTSIVLFIREGEREGWSQPRMLVIVRWRRAGPGEPGVASGRLSRVADRWGSVGVLNRARARMGVGCTVHQFGLLAIGFLFFQTELNL